MQKNSFTCAYCRHRIVLQDADVNKMTWSCGLTLIERNMVLQDCDSSRPPAQTTNAGNSRLSFLGTIPSGYPQENGISIAVRHPSTHGSSVLNRLQNHSQPTYLPRWSKTTAKHVVFGT